MSTLPAEPAPKRRRAPFVALSTGLGVGLSAAFGWAAYSAFFIRHNRELPAAIPAERRTFASRRSGILSYYVSRRMEGRPLVLIHSINAAASAYEMRPIFEYYQSVRPVYALDLPGFGFSDRANRVYSPDLYVDAITTLITTQVRESGPVDVIALSLGAEFAALAAHAHPELIRSLALISPTGLDQRQRTGGSEAAYRLLSFPAWSGPFYDLLVTPGSLRFFLQFSFEGEVNPGLLAYAEQTSHRPGARYAPLYFVSGKLFTPGIEAVYTALRTPTLVIHDRDDFTGFSGLPGLLAANPAWQAVRVAPTKGLPHFEKMEEVAEALDDFWAVAVTPGKALLAD